MNRLNLDDPRDRLLGRCLLRQAEAIPDRDFLIADDEHWSYGRVNELANAMAGALPRARRRARRHRVSADGEQPGLRVDDARPQQARRDLGSHQPGLQGPLAARAARGQPRARARRRRGADPARRRVRRTAAVRARGGARAGERGGSARAACGVARRARARAREGAGRSRALPRRYRRDPLDLGHHGPLEGRDAEPQRLDPRGGRRRHQRAAARGRGDLLVPADVSVGGVGRERLPRARLRRSLRDRCALLGARVLGSLPALRRDHGLHARRHAHLLVAAAAASRRRGQSRCARPA